MPSLRRTRFQLRFQLLRVPPSSRFEPLFAHPVSSPNSALHVSPNLQPTQGNSDSLSSSDFPISRGENKKGTQSPLRLDTLRKRLRTCHQNTGIESTNTFTSNRYAVKPDRRVAP